ncbi:MAG: UDP-N-acetylglucosamine 2-epimerase (non-hydrolyzing), partial [Bacteroidetes bacterium]
IVGTRPNFIKVTQFKRIAKNYPKFHIKILHTSQHYSDEMSKIFFNELDLHPDYSLDIPDHLSSVSQIAEIMKGIEHFIVNHFYPHLIIVVGDVNSTLAGALVANKMNIPLAHVESGLRSFDTTMPEEYNRILTDKMAQYFFVTEQDAIINLKNEFVPENKIFFVGNTMIDTLVAYQDRIEASDILDKLQLHPKQYILLTFHRPNNVDTPNGLERVVQLIRDIHRIADHHIRHIVFPIHPRTKNNFLKFDMFNQIQSIPSLVLTEPQSYLNFQKLIRYAFCVITDSGGVQEETTFLKIPCITLRPSTERPITLWEGSNVLLPFDIPTISGYIRSIQNNNHQNYRIPEFWDGKSTERIFRILSDII